MDFLTSLPADLAALADPSVRGAAPLLRPPDAAGETQSPTTPFALCLALLTEPLPGGEAWPATGKELPVAPLEPAAEPPRPARRTRCSLWRQPRSPPPHCKRACCPSTRRSPGRSRGRSRRDRCRERADDACRDSCCRRWRAARRPSTALAAPAAADLDPLAALAGLAAEAEPAPLETAAQPAAGTPAKTAAAPSWLEAFAEQRLQRPAALTPSELRAPRRRFRRRRQSRRLRPESTERGRRGARRRAADCAFAASTCRS